MKIRQSRRRDTANHHGLPLTLIHRCSSQGRQTSGTPHDLYQRYYQGKRLRPGDQVISVNAKPFIQARARCHPTSLPAPGRPARVEHEYERQGALALLAALDVHTGKVFTSTPATTGITPFMHCWARS
jgi:hypothetical protein